MLKNTKRTQRDLVNKINNKKANIFRALCLQKISLNGLEIKLL